MLAETDEIEYVGDAINTIINSQWRQQQQHGHDGDNEDDEYCDDNGD